MNAQSNRNRSDNPLGYSDKCSRLDMEKELINMSKNAEAVIVLDTTGGFLVHGNGERTEQFKRIEEQAKKYTFILGREAGATSAEVGRALKSLFEKGAQIRILGGKKVALPVEKLVEPMTMGISGRIFCGDTRYTALFTREAERGFFARLYLEDSALVATLHSMLLNLSVECDMK